MRPKSVLCLALVLLAALPTWADDSPAPEWEVSEWINGNPGTVAENRGRVILIHFFQLWCAACNEYSQPLFDRWSRAYGDRDDLRIVGIHTVFEGHDQQSPERLRAWVSNKKIAHPVGVDRHPPGEPIPITMDRYNTGGTPHVAMIDREGRIRFDRFGAFDVAEAELLIDTLLAEPVPGSPPSGKTVAGSDRKPAGSRVSGAYRLQFRQTVKTCGRNRTLVIDPLIVEVGEDSVTFSYTEPYLRRTHFTLPFDAATGAIDDRSDIRVERDGLTVSYEFGGRLVEDSDPPQFEFDLWMEVVGDEEGSDCQLRVKGRAERK